MTFRQKENRVLTALGKGKVALGMMISTVDPSLIEILAYNGFDFYMLDMEHSRINFETMMHCVRAADAAGITTMVRVTENNPSLIRQSIESGAQGVNVPRVKNREDARKAVNSIRYPPEGGCGTCPSIRAANYSISGWQEYVEYSNKQTMVIPILEDKEAIENAEEIFAELKLGVDAVGFGRADLAQSITPPGQEVIWDHPYIMAAYDKLLALSKKTGIPIMGIPWPKLTAEYAKAAIDRGVKILMYGSDQLLFYDLCSDIARAMKRL